MKNNNNNKAKGNSSSAAIVGWMQVTLPDVPAHYLFTELLDVPACQAMVPTVMCIEPYDPTTSTKKSKRRQRSRRRGDEKQERKEDDDETKRIVEQEAQSTTNSSTTTTGNNNDSDRMLAYAGYCFLSKRSMLGGRKIATIKTRFTRVDDDFDPVTNQRIIWRTCTFYDCTVTRTYTIERLDGGGCTWTLSYALLPDGWYGRYLAWRHGKQLDKDVNNLTVEEFQGLHTAIRAKYHASHSTTSTITSSSTTTICSSSDEASSLLLETGGPANVVLSA